MRLYLTQGLLITNVPHALSPSCMTLERTTVSTASTQVISCPYRVLLDQSSHLHNVLPSPLAGCCLAPCASAMHMSNMVSSGSGSYSPPMAANVERACLFRSLARWVRGRGAVADTWGQASLGWIENTPHPAGTPRWAIAATGLEAA